MHNRRGNRGEGGEIVEKKWKKSNVSRQNTRYSTLTDAIKAKHISTSLAVKYRMSVTNRILTNI